jgi:hypothetical protein
MTEAEKTIRPGDTIMQEVVTRVIDLVVGETVLETWVESERGWMVYFQYSYAETGYWYDLEYLRFIAERCYVNGYEEQEVENG